MLADLGVSDFVVVSTRRSRRTTTEYVLRLKIGNSSPDSYADAVLSWYRGGDSNPQGVTTSGF